MAKTIVISWLKKRWKVLVIVWFMICSLVVGFVFPPVLFPPTPNTGSTVETRYMRSDTQAVNGLTAYALNTSQSSSATHTDTSGIISVALNATLYPINDNATAWPTVYPASPTTHYDKVDDVSADDAATETKTGNTELGVYVTDRYGKTAYTIPTGYAVALIRITCRFKTDTDGGDYCAAVAFGVEYAGTSYLTADQSNAGYFTTYTYDFAKFPLDNKPWNQSTLTNTNLAVRGTSDHKTSPSTYYLALNTQIFMTVYIYHDNTITYASDVVQRQSNGTEISLGAKIAAWSGTVSSVYITPELKSATWTCPTTSLEVIDSVVVKVYVNQSTAYTFVQNFTTPQLGAAALDNVVWTFYYYLVVSCTTSTVTTLLYFGNSTCNTRITNFSYTVQAPTYSNIRTTTTTANASCVFSVLWKGLLSGGIFGSNTSGHQVNDTWTPLTGTTTYFNVTKYLNDTNSVVIQWQEWVNDTHSPSLWNATGWQNLTVTSWQYLYVDGFSNTETAWATSGISPWLDDSESEITPTDANQNESWFTFANWNRTMPTQVWLELELTTISSCYLNIFLNNTVTVNNLGSYVIGPRQWLTINVSSYVDTGAKLNGTTLKFQSVNSTLTSVEIFRARLHIFFPVPIAYGYTTNVATKDSTLYCLWYSPLGLSTYKTEENNTGSIVAHAGSLTGTSCWINITVTLSSISINYVWVHFAANDTNNVWGDIWLTFPLLWSKYETNFVNFVGNSSQASTRHGLGRMSFYAIHAKLYFACYHNGTGYVATTSSDGRVWTGQYPVRMGVGGAGFFYMFYESRDGHDYVIYEYGNEGLEMPLYYRRAEILANGTFSWLADEQIVVAAIPNFQWVAVNGITIDNANQTYIVYNWGNATYPCIGANVTKTTLLNGTWVTASGYPKRFTSDITPWDYVVREYYCWSMENNTQIYIIMNPSGHKPQGRTLQNDVLGAWENLSDYLATEGRVWSGDEYQGNIYFVFTDTTGTIRCSIRTNTTGLWALDTSIRATGENARPITQISTTDNLLYVNWWENNRECFFRIYNLSISTWGDVERAWTCPANYSVASENSMMLYATTQTIFHATLCKLYGDTKEQWAYTYSTITSTYLTVGWNNFTATTMDVGKNLSQVNASLYVDSINFSQIGFEYANGTRYVFFPDWGGNVAVTVTANGKFYILCNAVGYWRHTYP